MLPFIIVQAKEVNFGRCRVCQLAAKVLPSVTEQTSNISCRVANRNCSGHVLGDVVFHVASHSANVGGSIGSAVLVDDLVTRKESKKVRVRCKSLDDAEDMGKICVGVSGPGCGAVEVGIVETIVYVEDHVDTSSVEDGSTLIVVDVGDQVVDSDGVDTQTLQKDCISQASLRVAQRVACVRDAG